MVKLKILVTLVGLAYMKTVLKKFYSIMKLKIALELPSKQKYSRDNRFIEMQH